MVHAVSLRLGKRAVVASTRVKPPSCSAAQVPSARSVGTYPAHMYADLNCSPAIQLLKLSGFGPIITTASLHNTDLLKAVGATHVLNRYLSPEVLFAEIRKITNKHFTTIYDAAGAPETQNLGYDLLAPGGTLAAVQPDAVKPEKKVAEKKVFFMWGDVNAPQNRKLGASLYSRLTELLAEGALKVCVYISDLLSHVCTERMPYYP